MPVSSEMGMTRLTLECRFRKCGTFRGSGRSETFLESVHHSCALRPRVEFRKTENHHENEPAAVLHRPFLEFVRQILAHLGEKPGQTLPHTNWLSSLGPGGSCIACVWALVWLWRRLSCDSDDASGATLPPVSFQPPVCLHDSDDHRFLQLRPDYGLGWPGAVYLGRHPWDEPLTGRPDADGECRHENSNHLGDSDRTASDKHSPFHRAPGSDSERPDNDGLGSDHSNFFDGPIRDTLVQHYSYNFTIGA
jgi:hypothetical protein